MLYKRIGTDWDGKCKFYLYPPPANRSILHDQIVTLRPRTNPTDLTNIFRRAAAVILEEGGVVRSVANHGIRVLPYRFHSKHDIKEKDDRWFCSGRWASAYYDASPAVAKKMEVGRWVGGG